MQLTRNAYSPASLAKELDYVVSSKTIRRNIERGLLKAHRFGGKNLIIKRDDVEKWLNELPCATEKTAYHGLARGRGRPKLTEEAKQQRLDKAAQEIADTRNKPAKSRKRKKS